MWSIDKIIFLDDSENEGMSSFLRHPGVYFIIHLGRIHANSATKIFCFAFLIYIIISFLNKPLETF